MRRPREREVEMSTSKESFRLLFDRLKGHGGYHSRALARRGRPSDPSPLLGLFLEMYAREVALLERGTDSVIDASVFAVWLYAFSLEASDVMNGRDIDPAALLEKSGFKNLKEVGI